MSAVSRTLPPSPREGEMLVGALLTTYLAPDTAFLVEDFLPAILQIQRSAEAEDQGTRTLFTAELVDRIRGLPGGITVVSSGVVRPGEDRRPPYPWLLNHVCHLNLGRCGDTQHAKLWMLEWSGLGKRRTLEIVVSSTNLTAHAFSSQIQAGWSARVKLDGTGRSQSWGILPRFLKELSSSAGGGGAKKRIARFIDLLDECSCPLGVTFVASIPGGQHGLDDGPEKAVGLAALRRIARRRRGESRTLSVVAPFVGAWDADWLRDALQLRGGPRSRLELHWIRATDPWQRYWTLPASAKANLDALAGEKRFAWRRFPIREDDAPSAAQLAPGLPENDPRWWHAKLYGVKGRGILVTSANFSPSAWGRRIGRSATRYEIANFELGVFLDGEPLQLPSVEFGQDEEPFTSEYGLQSPDRVPVTWAEAHWDGRRIWWTCRAHIDACPRARLRCESERTLAAPLGRCRPARQRADPKAERRWGGSMSWVHGDAPVLLQVSADGFTLECPVVDERRLPKAERARLPHVSEAEAEAARFALISERYRAGDAESALDEDRRSRTASGSGPPTHAPANYRVEVLDRGRQWFALVDAVVAAMTRATADDARNAAIADARLLRSYFARRKDSDPAAGPVASELDVILRYE